MSTTRTPTLAGDMIAPTVALTVARRLDLEELGRIRSVLWNDRTARVQLDLCLLHAIDADAALLLYEDLLGLTQHGVRVRLVGASGRLQRILRRHPLRRFLLQEDDLFTDPDRESVAFRASRH